MFLSILSYFFFWSYLMLIIFLIFMNDLYVFWILMEFSFFLFMGVCYLDLSSNLSGLMYYYIIQSYASLMLLLSVVIMMVYPFLSFYFFQSFIFLKLALFPFSAWYYVSLHSVPLFTFILMLLPQKFPSILFNSLFLEMSSFEFSWLYMFLFFSVLNILFCSLLSSSFMNMRYMLILSSIMSGSWLYLSSFITLSIYSFFSYFYPYLLLMVPLFVSLKNKSYKVLFFLMMMLLGIPPSPLFVGKVMVLSSLMAYSYDTCILYTCIGLMVSSSLFIVIYLRSFSFYYTCKSGSKFLLF